ncbi:MAG: GNAT family N-acetyltransferase [Planctomycetota bacterium]
MIRLETDRLRVRDVTAEDVDFLCEIYATRRGVPDFPEHLVRTRAWVEAHVERVVAERARPGGMGIAERKADGVPVGRYGVLKTAVRPWPDGEPFEAVELGWYTHPDHRRHGYAIEAAAGCLTLARTLFPGEDVHAFVLPTNGPSNGVARALGMTEAGRVRHADLEHLLWRL